MMTIINFDVTNPVHAQIFAQVVGIVSQAGVPFQVGVNAPTQAPTPVSDAQAQAPVQAQAPKVLAPAEDTQCKWAQEGMYVRCTTMDDKYVGANSVRKVLNARLRDAGAVWNAEKKAYKFASKAKAKKFVADTSALVTAQEIEAARAKAQARAEKKAQKGA